MPDSNHAPSELRYTREHEWTRVDGDVVTVGITAYAQDQLGDVVYVELPTPGSAFEQGQTVGEVESTKSVSDLFAPVAGTVVAGNEALDERPELVNEDPYGEGWLLTIRPTEPDELAELLDAEGYRSLLGLDEES